MTHQGDVYRRLGVEPIINAQANMTVLGGSLMRPETLEQMRLASECFVDIRELELAVSKRIAELTGNEACFVSGGSTAGIFLATAACMTTAVPDGVLRFAQLAQLRDEVVVHRAHRIRYDQAFDLARAKLVEIGMPGGTTLRDLEVAISERTAMIFYVAGSGDQLGKGALPLDETLRMASGWGVPVVVDAAGQIPPVSNLRSFTESGADLVLFSGGKGLRGPASTGLVLGRKDLVARCRVNAAPNEWLGRAMKVSKEDLVGILSAVELSMSEDWQSAARDREEIVASALRWGDTRTDVDVVRELPNDEGQPIPRVRIRFTGELATHRDSIVAELLSGRPRIAVRLAGCDGIYVNPQVLQPGEVDAVTQRLDAIL